jgi:hypothetical protein
MLCGDLPDEYGRDGGVLVLHVSGWVLLYGRDERDAMFCGDIPDQHGRNCGKFLHDVRSGILLHRRNEQDSVSRGHLQECDWRDCGGVLHDLLGRNIQHSYGKIQLHDVRGRILLHRRHEQDGVRNYLYYKI